jgi:hypothetical protein
VFGVELLERLELGFMFVALLSQARAEVVDVGFIAVSVPDHAHRRREVGFGAVQGDT